MAIVYGSIGWFIGLWLASLVGGSLPAWLASSGLAVAGVILSPRQEQIRGILLIFLGAGLGGARYISAVPVIHESHIAFYNGNEAVTLTGLVVDEPDVRDRSVNLRVAAEQVTLADGTTQAVTGLVLVRAERFPVIEYGTRLEINGRLETPPEDPEFSYKDYLARQGIHSLIARPTINVLAERQGNPIYQAIFTFKAHAQITIRQFIPDPQAALLIGILLGDDNGLPPDLNEAFRTTGLTHIIAISGFNVSLIVAVLVGLSEPVFGKRGSAVFAIVGIAIYTLLVGADASVVRAAIMGSIFLFAHRWMGRPNFAYASLLLAGLVMTLWNPLALWDVGFQLSFAATLGLMLYATPITGWVRAKLLRYGDARTVNRVMGVLSEAVLLTLAAQVLTLPLMMAYFQQVSLISLVANAFVLPVQPGVMLWGGLTVIAGFIFAPLGQLLGWVAWLFLTYTITLVRLFAAVPGAAVPVHISTTGVIAIYGLIAALTWLAKQEPERRAQLLAGVRRNWNWGTAVGLSVLAAILATAWGMNQPDGMLHVLFLNVGQGEAVFIQTPSGRKIVVDGGLYPTVLKDQLGRHMAFWDNNLDMLVATHPDAEAISGLVGVFDRYTVGQLMTNGEERGVDEAYDALWRTAETAETPIHPSLAGETIVIEDGIRLEVLHPGVLLDPQKHDDNSVVLRLVYGEFSLLLPGAIGEETQEVLLENGRSLTALAVKANQHGFTQPFLEAVQPQILILPPWEDGPPDGMVEQAQGLGTAVLRLDELGTVEVITDGETMWWEASQ